MSPSLPLIDLRALPCSRQIEEYNFRILSGMSCPDLAIYVIFRVTTEARDIIIGRETFNLAG